MGPSSHACDLLLPAALLCAAAPARAGADAAVRKALKELDAAPGRFTFERAKKEP